MPTVFVVENITWFETCEDKYCKLVFTHGFRNFFQHNTIVLEIASFCDDLMYSSPSTVSIILGMLASNIPNISLI